jgi:glutamyl-tRNA reductase
MVVGEPQILGQLKQYYDTAQQVGTVGTVLHRLFHRSFSVAKRVRTETGIGSVESISINGSLLFIWFFRHQPGKGLTQSL